MGDDTICDNEVYAIMMLLQCTKTCNMCEPHKHIPTAKDKCLDTSLRCIRKSMKAKCETDPEVKEQCRWTCGECT